MEVYAPLDGPAGVSVLPQALVENLQGEGGSNPLRVLRLRQHPAEEEALPQPSEEKPGLPQLLGESPAFLAEIRKIPLLAQCDVNVLISGETGTGKELCARAIHYLSPRAGRPFIAVNCGAIPVELVENELFGHERGAFTDASTAQGGLIHEAEGGTLFLDEIACLPLLAQVKLLRFLQDKEYRRLGSTKTQQGDVRVVAAMNIDLEEAVREGKLRQDLLLPFEYYPTCAPTAARTTRRHPPASSLFLSQVCS